MIYQAENLKYKRTFSKKLIFIAPILTAIMSIMFGGLLNFQPQSIYWWYVFILPGVITIFTGLSEKKEKDIGYSNILTIPTNYNKIWRVRISVICLYIVLASILLLLPLLTVDYWVPMARKIENIYLIIGIIFITVAMLWQIPVMLYLAKKIGLFLPILINIVLSIIMIPLVNTSFWFLIPYTFVYKISETFLCIGANGVFLEKINSINYDEGFVSILLSFICFIIFTILLGRLGSDEDIE